MAYLLAFIIIIAAAMSIACFAGFGYDIIRADRDNRKAKAAATARKANECPHIWLPWHEDPRNVYQQHRNCSMCNLKETRRA